VPVAPQFVDANIFIRHLTGDDPVRAQACFDVFLRAQRDEVALTTSETVIAEVVYVLSSKSQYAIPRGDIRAMLRPILSLKGFKLRGRRRVLLRALDLYAAHPVDFEDALTVAQMEQAGVVEVLSYDAHFDRLPSVQRREP
jgi:predicted nucleic acid-binding protein